MQRVRPSRKPLGLDGADNYSTVPSALPDWMTDPAMLPRKSVAKLLEEQRGAKRGRK